MKPVLVLQMRRLGDLILTFPLLQELQKIYPQAPILMAAEPGFYDELAPFAPGVTFVSSRQLSDLAGQEYEAVINLDTNQHAAEFCGTATANLKLGPLINSGRTRINGFWQLYRAALTQNNRHNTFHWADLFRMDLGKVPPLPSQTASAASDGKIALFLGASEAAKRPEPNFWIDLTTRLKRQGFMPLLLGGPQEAALGREVASACKLGHANFCGKTSLSQLAWLLKSASLLITPDTGPMHLANWLGVPALNLSMGNVNPYETGPVNAGQLILRPAMSCAGCWQCLRGRPVCRQKFSGLAVTRIVRDLVRAMPLEDIPVPKGLQLLTVVHHPDDGLLTLAPIGKEERDARIALSEFWRKAFLNFGQYSLPQARNMENILKELYKWPRLAQSLHSTLSRLVPVIAKTGKTGAIAADFWQSVPWHTRIFTGFTQMALENSDFSRDAVVDTLDHLSFLVDKTGTLLN